MRKMMLMGLLLVIAFFGTYVGSMMVSVQRPSSHVAFTIHEAGSGTSGMSLCGDEGGGGRPGSILKC